MGLWGLSTISGHDPVPCYRAWFGRPYWPGGLWSWWQYVNGLYATHGCRAVHPAAHCDRRVVPPAYYVELRALEIRKEEIEASLRRREPLVVAGQALRPWPFRWPLPGPDQTAPESPPTPDEGKGEYYDVVM